MIFYEGCAENFYPQPQSKACTCVKYGAIIYLLYNVYNTITKLFLSNPLNTKFL